MVGARRNAISDWTGAERRQPAPPARSDRYDRRVTNNGRSGRVLQRRAALCFSLLMAIVAVFQGALVAGAPWGEYTQGGARPGPLSGGRRAAAGASMLVVLVFAAGALALHGIGPLRHLRPRGLQRLRRVTIAYGVVEVPMNLLTPSAKERRVWGPFTILSLVALLLAQPRRPAAR